MNQTTNESARAMANNEHYEELSDDELISLYNQSISKDLQHGFYKTNGFMLTERFKSIEKSIEDLEVFHDDVWLTSFPKSGITWLSEMVWLICNDLNTTEAKTPLESRVLFLEYYQLFRFEDASMNFINNSVKMVQDMARPRFIKSHLPWPLLPRQIRNFTIRPRIIHVARNPKDVAVSYYNHIKLFCGYNADPDLFYEMLIRGLYRCCPYMDNVHSYWHQREQPNVLFLKFEDMKNDLQSVILKTAEFLNVKVDDGKMKVLLNHLSFKNMKKNEGLGVDMLINYLNDKYIHSEEQDTSFFRKGKTGAHREEMKDDTVRRFNQWIQENMIYGLIL